MLYDDELEEYGDEELVGGSGRNAVRAEACGGSQVSYDPRDPREGGSGRYSMIEPIADLRHHHHMHQHPHDAGALADGDVHGGHVYAAAHHHHQHHPHGTHHHDHGGVLEGGDEQVEMEEMEEVVDDETGQRMLIAADGNVMYHPDDVLLLDDDGSTMTWKIELMDDEEEGGGGSLGLGTVASLGMAQQQQQPMAFDVSAYEVCDTTPSTSSAAAAMGVAARVQHMLAARQQPGRNAFGTFRLQQQRRQQLPPVVPQSQRFARLDHQLPPQRNLRHAKISRIGVSRGKAARAKMDFELDGEEKSCGSYGVFAPFLRDGPPPPPPAPPVRVPRRPTAKFSVQSNLVNSTQGLETANCNYCHLRFYMPRSALRSRITYGTIESQFELPNAYFECPICGMESASGPNIASRR